MQAIRTDPPASRASSGSWRDRFCFDHVKVLIVCRGPVRLEAITAFENLGAQPSGILLSEKDSVVYSRALAPELRVVGRNERVHRIPDYGGANAQEKAERIAQILEITRDGGYSHVFAGYGFMAEDHKFIQALEDAGQGFVGPSAAVARKAGAKDAAKALARKLEVSVTPGLDNIAALTLLRSAGARGSAIGGTMKDLKKLAARHKLKLPSGFSAQTPEDAAETLLRTAMAANKALVSLEELQAEATRQCARLLRENPGARLRLKHIGGGGGKGQRIISAPAQAADAVFEVLSESRAMGPGDNKNFLIELNVEETRHNEIQLLGNGEWCIALGGRDCSLQMHEQKLLEVSITAEQLVAAAAEAGAAGQKQQARVLDQDRAMLEEMEAEAERFGRAVRLDSASTFETIVHGGSHYFMEINTRIQVEHRVTEMVYGLRFTNPERPSESFHVDSLVEAMLWVAVHGRSLPRPERLPRHGSGAEARINTTNDALRPHAGGMVLDWTPPIEHEVRDDQGIGLRNPDTGTFMPYNLAGAYDSNAALVVSHGETREQNFRRLAEILRRMEVRGDDVMLNRAFHFGLLHWILGQHAMVKPTTGFVQAYLAAVGALHTASRDVNLDTAWGLMEARIGRQGPAAAAAFAAKATLILRPLRLLYRHPHLLAGWLAPRPERRWEVVRGNVKWRRNPLEVLEELYLCLRLETHPGVSPEERIWEQDQRLLSEGLAFYAELRARLGQPALAWSQLCALLEKPAAPGSARGGMTRSLWNDARSTHNGFQAGMDLLKLPVLSGEASGFSGLRMNDRLEPVVPAAFRDPVKARRLHAALAPPPPASGDAIVAWTGGMFYARPAPESPPYVSEGDHFEAGDVVGLLEVMKMFNPIRAEFSGTVTKALVVWDGGVIVAKGQALYQVKPDVPPQTGGEEPAQARREAKTRELMEKL